jgi:hypothetical protein
LFTLAVIGRLSFTSNVRAEVELRVTVISGWGVVVVELPLKSEYSGKRNQDNKNPFHDASPRLRALCTGTVQTLSVTLLR